MAAVTNPTTIIQNPILLSHGYFRGRPSPLMTVRVRKPVMKNVVQINALRTP